MNAEIKNRAEKKYPDTLFNIGDIFSFKATDAYWKAEISNETKWIVLDYVYKKKIAYNPAFHIWYMVKLNNYLGKEKDWFVWSITHSADHDSGWGVKQDCKGKITHWIPKDIRVFDGHEIFEKELVRNEVIRQERLFTPNKYAQR